jgi:hypothetical protein
VCVCVCVCVLATVSNIVSPPAADPELFSSLCFAVQVQFPTFIPHASDVGHYFALQVRM